MPPPDTSPQGLKRARAQAAESDAMARACWSRCGGGLPNMCRGIEHLRCRLLDVTALADREMAPFGFSPRLWWPNMGHVAQVPEEIELLRGFVTSGVPPVETACQVGHNAGHSAAAWLDGLDSVTLLSFDLFSLPYSNASKAFFRERYPGRVFFYPGRERRPIRTLAAATSEICARTCWANPVYLALVLQARRIRSVATPLSLLSTPRHTVRATFGLLTATTSKELS